MKKIVTIGLIATASLSFAILDKPTGLIKGDVAPDFSAKNQNGKTINLKNELKLGAVVLVFYRGQWCPYCNKQLAALQDSLELITSKGAQLIAVSPEIEENVAKTISKSKASYSVLSDDKLKIMSQYKVAYEVDDKLDKTLKKYGIDVAKANGENGKVLPVPAVYIINKEGKIVYVYFDENYAKRPSVKEIVSML
jgi:peroxiredoxin